MMLIVFVYGLGVGGAYPVVAAETSSVRLRAKSQAIGFMSAGFYAWLFNFTTPYMFDIGEGNLLGKIGFIFAALCTIAIVIVYFEFPEMKNKTYPEIDEMFEKRLPTKAFKDYISSSNGAGVLDAEK